MKSRLQSTDFSFERLVELSQQKQLRSILFQRATECVESGRTLGTQHVDEFDSSLIARQLLVVNHFLVLAVEHRRRTQAAVVTSWLQI